MPANDEDRPDIIKDITTALFSELETEAGLAEEKQTAATDPAKKGNRPPSGIDILNAREKDGMVSAMDYESIFGQVKRLSTVSDR